VSLKNISSIFFFYIVGVIENNKTCQHGLLQFKISMAAWRLPSPSLNLMGFRYPCTRPNLQAGENKTRPHTQPIEILYWKL